MIPPWSDMAYAFSGWCAGSNMSRNGGLKEGTQAIGFLRSLQEIIPSSPDHVAEDDSVCFGHDAGPGRMRKRLWCSTRNLSISSQSFSQRSHRAVSRPLRFAVNIECVSNVCA